MGMQTRSIEKVEVGIPSLLSRWRWETVAQPFYFQQVQVGTLASRRKAAVGSSSSSSDINSRQINKSVMLYSDMIILQ